MGVYYIMVIIQIWIKPYFYRPNLPFLSLSINTGGTRWNHSIVLGMAVALADTFAPMVMEFPRAIQMTSRTTLFGLPKQQVVENRCELMHQSRDCLPLKITWAQISSRDARFVFSVHAGAVVWPLFLDGYEVIWNIWGLSVMMPLVLVISSAPGIVYDNLRYGTTINGYCEHVRHLIKNICCPRRFPFR